MGLVVLKVVSKDSAPNISFFTRAYVGLLSEDKLVDFVVSNQSNREKAVYAISRLSGHGLVKAVNLTDSRDVLRVGLKQLVSEGDVGSVVSIACSTSKPGKGKLCCEQLLSSSYFAALEKVFENACTEEVRLAALQGFDFVLEEDLQYAVDSGRFDSVRAIMEHASSIGVREKARRILQRPSVEHFQIAASSQPSEGLDVLAFYCKDPEMCEMILGEYSQPDPFYGSSHAELVGLATSTKSEVMAGIIFDYFVQKASEYEEEGLADSFLEYAANSVASFEGQSFDREELQLRALDSFFKKKRFGLMQSVADSSDSGKVREECSRLLNRWREENSRSVLVPEQGEVVS